jgi:hypothetical protein
MYLTGLRAKFYVEYEHSWFMKYREFLDQLSY